MKIPRFLGKKIQKFRKTAVGPKMIPKYPKIAKRAERAENAKVAKKIIISGQTSFGLF